MGFPGETEADFQMTLSLLEEVRYDAAFTFLYSMRKGTPAASSENQVPEEIKHERFNRMREVLDETMAEKNRACEGNIEKVLVEGPSKTDRRTYTGRTASMKIVNFYGTKDMVGNLVDVKITKGKTYSLVGEVI